MKRTTAAFLTLGTLAVLAVGGVEAQEVKKKGYTKDPRILAYDKGPAKINVSKYPQEMKDAYKVYANRCAACHTLARGINSDYVLDEEWQQYIRTMMDKGGSLITADEAKTIYEFVPYDSRTRKKDLFDKKMALAAGTR